MPFTDSIKMVEIISVDKSKLSVDSSDVLSGEVYVGKTLGLEVGSLPNNASHGDVTIAAGESYIVPYGNNPDQFTVNSLPLDEQTSGTAEEEDILINKTAWVDGEQITGSMVDNGAVKAEIAAGGTYTIPSGYHNGSGVVTGSDLKSQTPADATASDIVAGKSAWVNGEFITGNIPDINDETVTLLAGETHTIKFGRHSGTEVVTAETLAVQTVGDATTKQIINNAVAWVNGVKITGSMPNNGKVEATLPINGSYTIPLGYHDGNGTVTQNIPVVEESEYSIISPHKDAQVLSTSGKYVTHDITVTGVTALNYQRPNTAIEDPTGVEIQNYDLTPDSSGVCTIHSNVDNWHDNATMNLYHVITTDLIDLNDKSVSVDIVLPIDWADQTTHTYSMNGINISIGLQEGTNSHTFTLTNVKSGKITIIETLSVRIFGDAHDTDD